MHSKSQLMQTHQTQELACITLEEPEDLSHGLFNWHLLRVRSRFCLHVYLCTVCVCSVPTDQKRTSDPWDWSYTDSCETLHVLEVKPGSLERSANALNQ